MLQQIRTQHLEYPRVWAANEHWANKMNCAQGVLAKQQQVLFSWPKSHKNGGMDNYIERSMDAFSLCPELLTSFVRSCLPPELLMAALQPLCLQVTLRYICTAFHCTRLVAAAAGLLCSAVIPSGCWDILAVWPFMDTVSQHGVESLKHLCEAGALHWIEAEAGLTQLGICGQRTLVEVEHAR